MLVGLRGARDVQQFSVTRWKLCGAAPQVSYAVTGVFRISFDPREVPVHPCVHARVIRQAASFAPRHHPCNPHFIVFFLFDCIPTNNDNTSKSFIYLFIYLFVYSFIHPRILPLIFSKKVYWKLINSAVKMRLIFHYLRKCLRYNRVQLIFYLTFMNPCIVI